MSKDLHDFKQFLKEREKVGAAYINGDAEPLAGIVTHKSPATFFAPRGGFKEGAKEVASTYASDANSYEVGGEGEFEILHADANNGLAYWVGFQRATAHIKGKAEPVTFNLRVTEVFRREDGEWKMIHRHADPLAEEK